MDWIDRNRYTVLACCASASDSVVVDVLTVDITQNDTTICEGDSIGLKVFSNSSYNGSSSLGGTLNNGLVAYYPFNGNASDESGNGNNGIVNGASLTTDRFGNIDAAYGFNNSYIQASASQLPTDERTVSVWFFSNDIGSGNLGRSLLGYGSGNTGPPNYTGAWSMTLDNIGSAFGQNSYG